MEKYSKLMKGLEACAGPDCCGEHCPYYGETRGGKTCRAWLLHDAAAAIANEEAGSDTLLELLHNTEAERDALAKECGELKEYALALEKEGQEARAERDKLNQNLTAIIQHRDELDAANNNLIRQRDDLIRANEKLRTINRDLDYQLGSMQHDMLKGKTDRLSVSDDALKSEYKRGYLDAMEYCFRELCKRAGGECCHD